MENERIYKENQILFSKLKDSKPHLPKEEHDNFYSKQRKISKNLSKEPQLKFLAAMNFNPTSSPIRHSPSMSVLASDRSKTQLPPISTRNRASQLTASINNKSSLAKLPPPKSALKQIVQNDS